MTEVEWLESNDPAAMLNYLDGAASDRKLRLFLCACARRVWRFIQPDVCRQAVEVAEKYADGLVDEKERDAAYVAARAVALQIPDDADAPIDDLRKDWATAAAVWAAEPSDRFVATGPWGCENSALFFGPLFVTLSNVVWDADARAAETVIQAHLLRDLFNNPFCPAPLDANWLSPEVALLAHAIYDGHAFDRLPELAAALEQAGCTNNEIHAHCRGTGPHARGCWVVDLLLGKR